MGLLGDLFDLGIGLAGAAVDGLLNSSASDSTEKENPELFNVDISDEDVFIKLLEKWDDIFQRDEFFEKVKVEEDKMPIIVDCSEDIGDVYYFFDKTNVGRYDSSLCEYDKSIAYDLKKINIKKFWNEMEIDKATTPCVATKIMNSNNLLYFGKCDSKIKTDYNSYSDVYRHEKLIRYYYEKNNYLEFRLRNVQYYSGKMYLLRLLQHHNNVENSAYISATWKPIERLITEEMFFEAVLGEDNIIYDNYTNFFETGLGKLEEKKKKEEEKRRKKEEQEQRKQELEWEREEALEEQARNDALSALDDI